MPSPDVSYKICLTFHFCPIPITLQGQEGKEVGSHAREIGEE